MQKDINIVDEHYFHSKGNENGACDMARVTIEMPISAWRAKKSAGFGDELISHQRRLSDLKKEDGVQCPNCCKDEILLRERTVTLVVNKESVKFKEVFYKCKRCNEEFYTPVMELENEKRKEMNLKKK